MADAAKTTLRTVWVLHGPSLNLLGTREPHIYGTESLKQVDGALEALAEKSDARVICRQSNREGELIDWVQEAAKTGAAGIVINAGGYSHTSVALGDALRAVALPAVEVHVSNVYAREAFRQTSHLAGACIGVVAGFGARSYDHALRALLDWLAADRPR